MAALTHQVGSPTCAASVFLVGTAPVVIGASNQFREAINIYNGGAVPAFLGYGATAVASQGWPVGAGAAWEESDFSGQLSAVSPGATVALFVVDIYGTGF